MRRYHADGILPEPEVVFVFGSNLAGFHGKGAALVAKEKFGASRGMGYGRGGNSYGIPTKSRTLKVLSLDVIQKYVNNFIIHAKECSNQEFFITRIGCGLAGYKDAQIAPMFKCAPKNCNFPEQWREFLDA